MDKSLYNKIRCLNKRLDRIEALISNTDISKNTENIENINENQVMNSEIIVNILNDLLKLTDSLANSNEKTSQIIDLKNSNEILKKIQKNLENIKIN